jgi:hypothetical protein
MENLKPRRINAVVTEEVFEKLRELAGRKRVTMTEVLRQAISLEKWFEDTRNSGARVLVERDGKTFEVAFPHEI